MSIENNNINNNIDNNVLIDITDLDLDTYDGQKRLLLKIQEILATRNLTREELAQIRELKSTIKIKQDLDIMKLYHELTEKIKKLEEKLK